MNTEHSLEIPRSQACRLLGLGDRTFGRLEAEGIIRSTVPRNGRRASRYDIFSLVPQYVAYLEQKFHSPRHRAEEQRARRDKSTADLNEERLARVRGEALSVAEVKGAWTTIVTTVRSAMLNLPGAVADQVVQVAAERGTPGVEAVLRLRINEILRELAAWRAPKSVSVEPRERKATKRPSSRECR